MISLVKRDGLARIANLNEHKLPMMIDFLDKNRFEFIDGVDFGYAPYQLSFIDEERYEILKGKESSISVVTGLRTLYPKKIVETIFTLRRRDWKPLYATALATPENLPLLIYLGVDIVDNILPIVEGYNGIYLLPDCRFDINSIKEFPCSCSVCSSTYPEDVKKMSYSKKSEFIALHNTETLENQIKIVREQIRKENLRNFVEYRSKVNTELTLMLKIADKLIWSGEELKKCFQLYKRSKALFTVPEFDRPDVRCFLDKSAEIYHPVSSTLVLLPCTSTKPYSMSRTHSALKRAVQLRGVNEIIISSPLVSPRELELCYPVSNYDTTVTGYWSADEVQFMGEKLANLISKGDFDKVIGHVEGGYRKVVEKASEIGGFEVTFTVEEGILSEKSIENLRREFENSEGMKFNLYEEIFRHMVRYQFGMELDGDFTVKGRFPELKLYSGKERILRIDTRYGMLDIDLKFAEILLKNRKYTVKIDDFEPKGTIFAAGVIEADVRIKPNDVVVFFNEKFLGTGQAIMCGEEMVQVDKGYAIKIRKKCKVNER
jgi:archaeosine synthase